MNETLLLILLIARPPMPLQLAFVEVADAEACRQREAMLAPLIAARGGRITASRCASLQRRFTPYAHAPETSSQATVWRVDLQARPLLLEQEADWVSCRRRLAEDASGTAVCALSRQRPEGRWARWWRRLRQSFSN